MALSDFSVNNRVFANIIMIAVLTLGSYAFLTLPRELFSQVPFHWVFISTKYPGASPEDVEKLVTKPIEDAVADVDYIDTITSHTGEGRSFISIKFEHISDTKFDSLLQDVRGEVAKVTDLPKKAEQPLIINFETSSWMPIATVVLGGNLPPRQLKQLADDLEDRILEIKDMAEVRMAGHREREIWVEVDPQRLQGYHLSLEQISQQLRAHNLNLPAGNLKVGQAEYRLRTMGEFSKVDEIGQLIVRWQEPGGHILLKDIATIKDTYEEPVTISRLNGQPCITLWITKKPAGNSIAIIQQIKQLLAQYRQIGPPGVEFSLVNDSSEMIANYLGKLQSNAWWGMGLVVLILYLTMGWRNAICVGMGIPVAFMTTFLFMKYSGSTLNADSLFGLVLVLGMIVDDAIVVMENIYRYIFKGMNIVQAAKIGLQEVIVPVTSSSATTMAAFLPLMLMPGIIGRFMRIVPIVVCLALLASLFEAILILPTHIVDWGKLSQPGWGHRLFRKWQRHYLDMLKWALRYRYLIVVLAIALAVLSLKLIPLVGVDMFAYDELPQFFIHLTMPAGTKLEATDEILSQIERTIRQLPPGEVRSVITKSGTITTKSSRLFGSHLGEVIVELTKEDERQRLMDEIIAELRAKTTHLAGIKRLEFKKMHSGPPMGKAVEVKVKGAHFERLLEVAAAVEGELAKMPGVYDIGNDFLWGKNEIKVYVDNAKAALWGLDNHQIAHFIRTAFEGRVATVMRQGEEEIDIVVKLQQAYRQNITDLNQLQIMSPGGELVPLSEIAQVKIERGLWEIRRFQRQRAITVSAQVDKEVTSAVKVNQTLEQRFVDIARHYPGYKLDFRGEFDEFRTAFESLKKLFVVGLVLIYIILGAQFKSFAQPLVIMLTVPFAFIGAMLGLLVTGSPFSITTLYGIVGLAGIVVNDSIVLVDFINRARQQGVSKWGAILRAGRVRLQPILLTSITTMLGLLPMAAGLGGRSAIWGPLANTIVWGLGVATLLILFVIPAFYAIVDDWGQRLGMTRFQEKKGGKQNIPVRP